MTISSATNKVIYTANGVLTDFDFTFKTQNASDIQVYLDDVLQGSGYTVVLNSDQETTPGGTVIFDVAPADQVIVTIAREVPLNQEVDYQPYDPFPANTHEAALDKLTMQNQQQQEELDRTTKASISDDGTTDYTLPLYDAGKAIVWDDPTKQLVNSNDKINDITDTAQQSADDAAVSAAAADSSANDSAASAVESAGYATDADNTLKDFETKYLGSKTSDPALDNEGNALIDGALYYNTTNNVMRVYDLGTTTWLDIYIDAYTKVESDNNFAPKRVNAGTIATTSGTAHDFTNIPSWVTKITLSLEEVSLSGSDHLLVQLGDAGGIETTGYVSTSAIATGGTTSLAASSTAGLILFLGGASNLGTANIILMNVGGNKWIASHAGKLLTTSSLQGGGSKTLSDVLTQLRITRNGINTFDNGEVTLFYE